MYDDYCDNELKGCVVDLDVRKVKLPTQFKTDSRNEFPSYTLFNDYMS